MLAVQAARDDSCNGGLAGPPLPGENVAMGDAITADRILESGPNVLLADQLGEILRSVLAREYLIHR